MLRLEVQKWAKLVLSVPLISELNVAGFVTRYQARKLPIQSELPNHASKDYYTRLRRRQIEQGGVLSHAAHQRHSLRWSSGYTKRCIRVENNFRTANVKHFGTSACIGVSSTIRTAFSNHRRRSDRRRTWDQDSAISKVAQLQEELASVRHRQKQPLNLRMLEEIDADTFASTNRDLRDRTAEFCWKSRHPSVAGTKSSTLR